MVKSLPAMQETWVRSLSWEDPLEKGLTLCDPLDCSPPGSSVHETFRQDYWSELPFPTPGDLPDPEIKPTALGSPTLQADSLPLSHQGSLNSFILSIKIVITHT